MQVMYYSQLSNQLELVHEFLYCIFRLILRSRSVTFLMSALPKLKKYSEIVGVLCFFSVVYRAVFCNNNLSAINDKCDEPVTSTSAEKKDRLIEGKIERPSSVPEIAETDESTDLESDCSSLDVPENQHQDEEDSDLSSSEDPHSGKWLDEKIPVPKPNRYVVTETSIIVNHGRGFICIYDKDKVRFP